MISHNYVYSFLKRKYQSILKKEDAWMIYFKSRGNAICNLLLLIKFNEK